MPSNNHVKEAMETLLKMFEEGNLEKLQGQYSKVMTFLPISGVS
jgi:hypothetical protein